MTVEYGQRHVKGRMRLADAPEPGTLLGPNDTREMMVVLGQDDKGRTLVGYALAPDVEAARQRLTDGGAPRSIAERGMKNRAT